MKLGGGFLHILLAEKI